MQIKNNDNTLDDNQDSKSCIDRRKRVNRLKTAIVIIVFILILLPTIGCIILGIQVSRLQKQMNDLVSIHNQYGLTYDAANEQYAYAAEKTEVSTDITVENRDNKQPAVSNQGNEQEVLSSAVLEERPLSTEEALAAQALEGNIKSDMNKNSIESDMASDLSEEAIFSAEENETTVKKTDKSSGTEDKEKKDKSKNEIKSFSTGIYSGKKVYLTFDDGPSTYTDDILDILDKYNVKATFFVVGKTDKESKELYKRIVDEGHILGMHSYSHVYNKIYNSVEDFDKDFTKLWKLLYDTTGYKPSIFRFPGGSDNLVNKNGMEKFIHYLNEASIVYFDWNVLNGDATGEEYTKEQLTRNVLDGVANKDTSIVLMHDAITKKTTVDSLPGLLDSLISEGAEILPLDKEAPPIQMIKADSIK